jgi:hypothetical protein
MKLGFGKASGQKIKRMPEVEAQNRVEVACWKSLRNDEKNI